MRIIRFVRRASIVGLCLTLTIFSPADAARRRVPPPAMPMIYVGLQRTHVPAIVERGQVLVPVRGVFEAIGANVAFAVPHFVVVRQDSAVIAAFILGRRHAIVGHRAVDLAAPPARYDGRIYVPLRIVAQAAGATVVYANRPRLIRIWPRAGAAALPLSPSAAIPVVARDAEAATHAAMLQWLVGVAVVTAVCCLACLILLARRFAPFALRGPRPVRPIADVAATAPAAISASDVGQTVAVTSVESSGEARFSKQLVTETRTIQVPVTREELVIEYVGEGGTVIIEGRPLGAGETLRIPLWEERVNVDVTKHVLVKEDIVIAKRRTILSTAMGAPSLHQREPGLIEEPS